MIRLTRRYHFCASHRLHSGRLSEAENRELYGKCNNPFGHGHNYVLEVTVRGPIDGGTGRSISVAALDALVRERVLQRFDHANLNTDDGGFKDTVPTSENLSIEIHRSLTKSWNTAFGEWPRLEGVRVAETARNLFEVRN